MKKNIVVGVIASFMLTGSALAVEQCDVWFSKNDFGIAGTVGKNGTGVSLDKNGELSKIFASGSVHYDISNGGEIDDALNEANMRAKANLAKFLKEEITTEESIDKITDKKKELAKINGSTNISATKNSVKNQTLSIKTKAKALLAGVIKVCESHDADKKEIQVVWAVSPNTIAASTKAANMFNKEIGSRKSAEEYAAERKQNAVHNNSQSDKTTHTKDGSFSNKATNMNF
jgi:hypothetical protein